MPVIKRGNRLVGAGQAAAAYGNATAGQRGATLSRIKLERQREQFDLARAERADRESQRRIEQEKAFELQGRRIDRDNSEAIRRQLGRHSQFGRQVNGKSMIQMATRVSQLDRQAYEQMDREFDALTGGVFTDANPPTPEALDALANKEAVYGLLGRYLEPLERAADQRAVAQGFEDLQQNIGAIGGDWLETAEGVQWASGLEQDFARAQKSGSGFTGAQAQALYREHQAKAAAAIQIHKRRQHYAAEFDLAIKDPKYAGMDEELHRAAIIMAGIGTARDPRATFVKALTQIDADFRLASQMAYADGQKQGALGASVARARSEAQAQESRRQFQDEFASQQMSQMPDSIDTDERAGVAKALGLQDSERAELREEIKASGIDLDDEEAVRAFIASKLQKRRLSESVYKSEPSQGRFQ